MGGITGYSQLLNANVLYHPSTSASLTVASSNNDWAQLNQFFAPKETRVADGTKPIVICRGNVTEAKDLDDAQRIAESEAHAKSADAYILKPIKRIAPKREVTTVDL